MNATQVSTSVTDGLGYMRDLDAQAEGGPYAWWAVRHTLDARVVTLYRRREDAEEHANRAYYRFGKRPLVVGAHELP